MSGREVRPIGGMMGMIAALLAIAAGIACAAPPPPVGASGTVGATAAGVEEALRKFEAAWESENLEAAVGAFSPDAVVFDPVPPGKFEGREAIRGWTAGAFGGMDGIAITMSETRVQTEGSAAWATSHYLFECRSGGGPMRVEGDLTTVWKVQADGGYRMSIFHASHLPAPAAAAH